MKSMKSIKVIPTPRTVDMGNDDDIFHVAVEEFCSEFVIDIEQGYVHANDIPSSFEKWLDYASDVKLSGWGKNSGRKLWQVSQKLQREIYRNCRTHAATLFLYPKKS